MPGATVGRPVRGFQSGARWPNDLITKKFLEELKIGRLSVERETVGFIGPNPVFFTKIHQKEKSCQSYHRFQIPNRDEVRLKEKS